uniref:Uncharacterized protein n=1 Tax=Tanacetum cinerariifolium TaxID=118510 RepID=A0A6L2JJL6_TANCI|nr:hypothetical protein [Tanacetum cinerariifolium]
MVKKVNELRAGRITKNAKPLALVTTASPYPDPYYEASKSHKPYAPTSKQSSSTRSNASTKFNGKDIAKPITSPFKSASEEDNDPKQAQKDKDMQKNLTLIVKELVDQAWEKHSHDHFRAPTAHDMEILIKKCLMPLAIKTQNDSFTFVHELKQEMHADLKYVESFENEIDELKSDKA